MKVGEGNSVRYDEGPWYEAEEVSQSGGRWDSGTSTPAVPVDGRRGMNLMGKIIGNFWVREWPANASGALCGRLMGEGSVGSSQGAVGGVG